MRTRDLVLALLLLGMLAGCGQPTPYQPATEGYGYREQQIEDNRYRVSFAGNDLTTADTVQNYLLYRAAELTLGKGYDYFTMVDRDVERSTMYWGAADAGWRSGHYRRWDDDYMGGAGLSTYTAQPVDRYTAYADIVMFEGEKPQGDVNAYDARDVLRQLDPTIQAAPGRGAPHPPIRAARTAAIDSKISASKAPAGPEPAPGRQRRHYLRPRRRPRRPPPGAPPGALAPAPDARSDEHEPVRLR